MYMTNKQIKEKAYQAVIEHEKQEGRETEIIEKDGYDILSKSGSEERHIEVKGTAKKKPTFICMQPKEFKKMLTDDSYYLYLVRDVGNTPIIKEYKKDEVLKRLKGVEMHYTIGFSAKEFKDGEEKPHEKQPA